MGQARRLFEHRARGGADWGLRGYRSPGRRAMATLLYGRRMPGTGLVFKDESPKEEPKAAMSHRDATGIVQQMMRALRGRFRGGARGT